MLQIEQLSSFLDVENLLRLVNYHLLPNIVQNMLRRHILLFFDKISQKHPHRMTKNPYHEASLHKFAVELTIFL